MSRTDFACLWVACIKPQIVNMAIENSLDVTQLIGLIYVSHSISILLQTKHNIICEMKFVTHILLTYSNGAFRIGPAKP